MDSITVLGLVAASSTTLSFLPQVWTILKTRNTQGISLGMYSFFTVGVFLWLVYGVMVGDAPIVVANAITFTLAATVLGLTIHYNRKAKRGSNVVSLHAVNEQADFPLNNAA